MRRIVKAFRRPPTGRMDDRNGGFPRLSDVVAHALRCPASPRRTLKAENLGKPSLWVSIIAPWYQYGGADENSAGDFSMGARSDKSPTGNGGALLMRFG